jgi:hypothetical protein
MKTRAYNVAKHLTIEEAVKVCRAARDAVDEFDALQDNPSQPNVNAFKASMATLAKIVRPEEKKP